MLPIEPLGLHAKQWEFLSEPGRFVEAAKNTTRRLMLASTKRQFLTVADILARLNGSFGERPVRGILLADDVGLGKTTVGALAAWIVASAGDGRSVRILAPNDLVMRRWEKELHDLVAPLRKCAQHLGVDDKRVKVGRVQRLPPRSIQVAKHSYAASGQRLACDLLIVDEAHRAKGDSTAFSRALKRQRRNAKRILILTATPFSIEVNELNRMLKLIDAEEPALKPVRAFKHALDNLYSGSTGRSAEQVAATLADRAQAAVEALVPYVIRHGVEDLPTERDAFGHWEEWAIPVPPATAIEQELIIRMDRVVRLAEGHFGNSPRFHVGWLHYDHKMRGLDTAAESLVSPAKEVVRHHLSHMRHLRRQAGCHTKMVAVGDHVAAVLRDGEKVIIFCDHISTAQELAMFLHDRLPGILPNGAPGVPGWKRAWVQALGDLGTDEDLLLRETFVRWLCSDLVRAQTWEWICAAGGAAHLSHALETIPTRSPLSGETIVGAAKNLYAMLIQSRSSRAVLKAAGERLDLLPGAARASRVIAVCERPSDTNPDHLFTDSQQPDTAIAVFNSPFGPDVLVGTDRLSEGIDLHRYCRHLIHYELDPSPIRTVQRNGRLRRVGGWAPVTNTKILYAYPAFRGTRDYRLVQIMKKRIDSFSLLLGGVQGFEVEQVNDADETWRSRVIHIAKTRLSKAGGMLRARERR